MRSLLGIFTYNWKLKGSALALALLLWVTVTADQIAVQRTTVPVEVEVRDNDFRLVSGPEPGDVQVRISGPRREFWDLGMNPPRVRLVLRNVAEGESDYLLEAGNVQIPQGAARGLTVEDVTPRRITLAFERIQRATIPVELRIGGLPGQGFTLAEGPVVSPATVTLTGPAARIAGITAVQTEALDLSRVEGPFEQTLALDLGGMEGIEASADRVTVRGSVERAVQQLLAEVPVRSPAGVLVVPGSVDVQLWGPEGALRRLDPAVLRVVVPPESIPAVIAPGGTSVPLRVEALPAGVRATPEPRTVRLLAVPQPPPAPEVRDLPPPASAAPADTVGPGPGSDA